MDNPTLADLVDWLNTSDNPTERSHVLSQLWAYSPVLLQGDSLIRRLQHLSKMGYGDERGLAFDLLSAISIHRYMDADATLGQAQTPEDVVARGTTLDVPEGTDPFDVKLPPPSDLAALPQDSEEEEDLADDSIDELNLATSGVYQSPVRGLESNELWDIGGNKEEEATTPEPEPKLENSLDEEVDRLLMGDAVAPSLDEAMDELLGGSLLSVSAKEEEEARKEKSLPGVQEVEEKPLPGVQEVEEKSLPGVQEVEEKPLPEVQEVEEKARTGKSLPEVQEVEEKSLPGVQEVEEKSLPGVQEVLPPELEAEAAALEIELASIPHERELVEKNLEAELASIPGLEAAGPEREEENTEENTEGLLPVGQEVQEVQEAQEAQEEQHVEKAKKRKAAPFVEFGHVCKDDFEDWVSFDLQQKIALLKQSYMDLDSLVSRISPPIGTSHELSGGAIDILQRGETQGIETPEKLANNLETWTKELILLLDAEKVHKVRATFLPLLGKLGSPLSVAAIRLRFGDSDARVRANALEALFEHKIPTPETDVFAMLDDKNERAKTNAIIVICRQGLTERIEDQVKALSTDGYAWRRTTAFDLLARYDAPWVPAHLVEVCHKYPRSSQLVIPILEARMAANKLSKTDRRLVEEYIASISGEAGALETWLEHITHFHLDRQQLIPLGLFFVGLTILVVLLWSVAGRVKTPSSLGTSTKRVQNTLPKVGEVNPLLEPTSIDLPFEGNLDRRAWKALDRLKDPAERIRRTTVLLDPQRYGANFPDKHGQY